MAALPGVALFVAGLLLCAAAVAALRSDGHLRPAPRSAVDLDPSAVPMGRISVPAPARPRRGQQGRRRPAPLPVRIEIPAVGVRARIIRLGLTGDHTLQVPRNFADTGWWAGGPRPGEPGPAVVVGHVDSYTGPAVYYRLRELRRGDRISIVRANRSVVRFSVLGLRSYPKAHFPTTRVYGATRRPTLRLITCSGAFDRSTGHYLDNTVVFATLAARR
jgi:Sortase domain